MKKIRLIPVLSILLFLLLMAADSEAEEDDGSLKLNVYVSDDSKFVNNMGLSGKGVKIGVMDGGFHGYETNQNIKNRLFVRSFRLDSNLSGSDPYYDCLENEWRDDGDVHGNAVVEVISRMAPNATLYLVNFENEEEFEQALEWLVKEEVDIITMSLGFLNEGPLDGSGEINEMIGKVVGQGILFISSAGNEALSHWSGEFRDEDGNGFTEFEDGKEYLEFKANRCEIISIFLSWDDWPHTNQDYDFYLYRVKVDRTDEGGDRTVQVAASEDEQDGTQEPVEEIGYLSMGSGKYRAKVKRSNGTEDLHMEIFNHYQFLDTPVGEASILIPADSPSVVAVGATFWRNDRIQLFSSMGPTRDGRIKPDLVGPDGMSNSVYGMFFGTSASAPYTAAVASLLLEADPTLSSEELYEVLELGAVDLGEEGPDNTYGSGRVDIQGSLSFVRDEIPPVIWDVSLDPGIEVSAVVSDLSIYSALLYALDEENEKVVAMVLASFSEADDQVFRINASWAGKAFHLTDGRGSILYSPVPAVDTGRGYYLAGSYYERPARLYFDENGTFTHLQDSKTGKELSSALGYFTPWEIKGFDPMPVHRGAWSFSIGQVTPRLVPFNVHPGRYEVGLSVKDYGKNIMTAGVSTSINGPWNIVTYDNNNAVFGDGNLDGKVSTAELYGLLGWIDLSSRTEVSWMLSALEKWEPIG